MFDVALHPTAPQSGLVVAGGGHLLAEVSYGAACMPVSPGQLAFGVPLVVLGGASGPERWYTDEVTRCGRRGVVRWSQGAASLFGVAAVPCGRGQDLERATFDLYREILVALGEAGFPWPQRIWNVLPAINREDDGLERYRRFCRGRSLAFEEAWGPNFATLLCSASAVGSADDGPGGDLLHVSFLASKEPGRQWENPRQVPAWCYPTEHGPRSPSFSRATTLPAVLGGHLVLSGTASIRGHESVPGDLDAQFDETLVNLAAVVNSSRGRALEDPQWVRELVSLKVYLRHREDYDYIAARLAAAGVVAPTLFVEADICRRELLLEIEGVATGGPA